MISFSAKDVQSLGWNTLHRAGVSIQMPTEIPSRQPSLSKIAILLLRIELARWLVRCARVQAYISDHLR